MKTPKYTKGEWKVFPVSQNTPNELPICTKEGIGIAITYLGDGSTEELEEGKANAKLISAAPELLEIAKQFKRFLEKDRAGRSPIYKQVLLTIEKAEK